MSHKHFSLFFLVLSGATSGFAQVTLNTIPSRIVGHPTAEGFNVTNFNPNLVEGRELYSPAGLAIDTSATPPVIYVSDSGNNRVLAWKNPAGFTSAAPADLVIGQPDMFTTIPSGPGTTFSAGLSAPTGLAVFNGDLYVVDSGNNRVLRFPKPFANVGQEVPNLIIGQPSLTSRVANYPSGSPTASGITLVASSTQVYSANLAFDASGNLWLTDPGNRRVLEFKSTDIAANPSILPAATMVIGQQNFTSLLPNLTSDTTGAYSTTQLYVPEGIAFDASGRLYISDADTSTSSPGQRVLVFNLTTSKVKIIGLPPQSGPTPTQAVLSQTLVRNVSNIFFLPNNQGVGVVDKGHSRIMIYPPYEQWTDALVALPATQVVGHNGDFTDGNPNNAPAGSTFVPPATASTMALPAASIFWNNELYLADTGNNRVVVLPLQGSTFGGATRVLGQLRFDTNSINLIEGKEFEFSPDTGLAVDSTGATPHLYVADTGNHRVLGFKDLRTVNGGSKADIVIGQPDFDTAICNYNASSSTRGGNPNQPNQSSLCGPIGLAVDASGNLYVADSLNGRVLRFPAPFSHQGQLQSADLVLGQKDFTSQFTDPSQFSMKNPYGLAFAPSGLLVSDIADNRVLYFPTTAGPLSNGQGATKVYGQGQFNTITSAGDGASLKQPRHISADTDGLVYVVDSGNSRVQIFSDPNSAITPTTGAQATLSITDNLNSPRGVYVSPITGQIWVTDTNNNRVKQYPRFDQLQLNPAAATTIPAAAPTLALTQDQYGDLFVADFSHRVAIYFPAIETLNGANFLPGKPLAPGVVASICAPGSHCLTGASIFNTPTIHAVDLNPFPLPTTLGDFQVLFNGTPTPIYDVSASQINFVVPMGKQAGDIPTSGNANIQVIKASTGQILAAGSVPMTVASPGIIELQYTGTTRQAAVRNQDNSVNGPNNPAARGSVITIYATGQGFTPGAPPDGAAPQSPVNTPTLPTVAIGSCRVDDPAPPCNGDPSNILYSGLNSFPGGWQLNVRIPQSTAPGSQVPLAISINGVPNTDLSFRMVIAVN